MESYYAMDPATVAAQDTDALRKNFLSAPLMQVGKLSLNRWEVDRALFGMLTPADDALELKGSETLRCEYFCQRRELGIINLGGPGAVEVDGQSYPMSQHDGLYIGRGSKSILLVSESASVPAMFYFVSYPAHKAYPTTLVERSSVTPLNLGSKDTANERDLYKVIHPGSLDSCQLVMGYTRIRKGSVWNTMPPHTHDRRSEIYCYYGMDEGNAVVHLMGEPQQTRHLMVKNFEVVMSPSWSIHAGAGTSDYSFVWAMGGENQDFDDMDSAPITSLR